MTTTATTTTWLHGQQSWRRQMVCLHWWLWWLMVRRSSAYSSWDYRTKRWFSKPTPSKHRYMPFPSLSFSSSYHVQKHTLAHDSYWSSSRRQYTSTTTIFLSWQPPPSFSSSSSSSDDIFVMAWDGVVAKSTDWRICQGMDAAMETWPHLRSFHLPQPGSDTATAATTAAVDQHQHHHRPWFYNKMKALSHVMLPRPSLTCDYALLARLLMEEQLLDQGRSNGSNGKYAKQFHPSAITSTTTNHNQDDDDDNDHNDHDNDNTLQLSSSSSISSSSTTTTTTTTSGSRPLTVGEIAVNWNHGGCLSETLLTRYHCQGQNPLPILLRTIEALSSKKQYPIPETNTLICHALASCVGKVIITVGHWSDVAMAEISLRHSNLNVRVAYSVEDALRCDDVDYDHDHDDDDDNGGSRPQIVLLSSHTDQRETSTLHQLLRLAKTGSTVYVVDGSYPLLQQETWLFGDDVPRGMVDCTCIGDNLHLSLNLAEWAENSHVSQHTKAEMDPWIHLMTEEQFAELVSARIV